MNKLIAPCGLDCADCAARKATLTNDDALRAATAERWTKEYGISLAMADVNCTGCKEPGAKIGHCAECGMRTCSTKRGFATCAPCPDYGTCETLGAFLRQVPFAKANLDALRAAR